MTLLAAFGVLAGSERLVHGSGASGGRQLYESGLFLETAENNLEKAIELYQQASSQDSGIKGLALYREALCYDRLGRREAAIKAMEEALAAPGSLSKQMSIDGRNDLLRWRAEQSGRLRADTALAVPGAGRAGPGYARWAAGAGVGGSWPLEQPVPGLAKGQAMVDLYGTYRLQRNVDLKLQSAFWFPKTQNASQDSGDSVTTFIHQEDRTRNRAFYVGPAADWEW